MKVFPEAVLKQHIGVVGKTGSGKTSTTKLLVEQVVAEGARVCIIDPIKSDHWGLTSSANGKHPGLPFQIIGGPKKHVALHPMAGAAIGAVVASGAVRLSIIDMADFEPGEPQRFFVDFAKALFKNMTGVVYLVIEEAHVFAPKERAGFSNENMAMHYYKKLATGSRSKGIRLVACTQRTQELHNAVLGSCDTIIAHRTTLPADQKPIVDWLRGTMGKQEADKIESGLSSLRTGEGWICSGEAKILECRQFPRISTYDNSATPTGDGHAHEIKTAPIDQDALRNLIGDAVIQAESNDPKKLKERVASLERQLATASKATAIAVKSGADPGLVIENRDLRRQLVDLIKANETLARKMETADGIINTIDSACASIRTRFTDAAVQLRTSQPPAARGAQGKTGAAAPEERGLVPTARIPVRTTPPDARTAAGSLTPRQQRFLDVAMALKMLGKEVNRVTVCAWMGIHPRGGSVGEELSAMVQAGVIEVVRGDITITAAGENQAQSLDVDEAIAAAMDSLDPRPKKILGYVKEVYPDSIARDEVAEKMGIHPRGGSFGEDIAALTGRGLITNERGQLTAKDFLFGA